MEKFDSASYGKRLLTLRNKYNLTQKQISDELGITAGAFSGIERGANPPSRSQVCAIQQYFAKQHNEFRLLDWWIYGSDIKTSTQELEQLKKDVRNLEEVISAKDELVKSKDEVISLLRGQPSGGSKAE